MSLGAVCVFAGSHSGKLPAYAKAAARLGQVLADEDTTLVYGGGAVGLMGVLADSVLDSGGRVTGVIPQFLVDREVANSKLTRLEIVQTMHERKHRMFELADAFIALPGGLGTLEELFEILTWAQLGRHRKPCGLLNVAGYYDGLVALIEHSIEHGFVREQHRELLCVGDDPGTLLQRMAKTSVVVRDKWNDT
ncbi:MAG: TIGR00730 family Rossman fold protein [Gammaproteobacteria bacterium]|nr:TIGR00730 family Rossman fold protein [Gammaproteobacteria bacterium]NND60363.1 TIGR00730 family Rossman fold protein [Gammaproteobacteria bacterium]